MRKQKRAYHADREGVPRVADRMKDIQPFHVMALLGRARELEAQGRDIVHLEVGEPDFVTPEPICLRGAEALAAGQTHYTPAAGLPALRESIAAWYQSRFAVSVSAQRILVTPGASGALSILAPCLFGPGDEVLMPDPGYPCNRSFVLCAGATPVMVPVGAADGWQLTPERVAAHWSKRTRAVLLASPANPTGTVLSQEQLQAICDAVASRGGVVICDEIYQGLQYSGEPCTALQCSENVFVVNSFSKYFGMTGWRVGWLVAPQWACEPLERLAQNVFLAAPTLAQHAALAAFEPAVQQELQSRCAQFEARRNALLDALNPLPLRCLAEPGGAFYLYLDLSATGERAMPFCQRLLEEHGVAVTPGNDFGQHEAEQRIRIAYTTDEARLREGVERMRCAIAR